MPGGAFGDGMSGAVFAGGIAAAIAQRERTGEGCIVDGSLLGTAMWALQPGIVGSTLIGLSLTMVSSPVQFDRAPSPISPAPELGAHTDEVMAEIGLDEDAIIAAKISGILL